MTYQNLISKGGNAFKIIMLILTLSILNLADSATLEMRTYNVGQANFIALKHGTNALIVDCGMKAKPSSITERDFMDDIRSFLEDSTISIAITHQDLDHFNKLNELLSVISSNDEINLKRINKIIIGGTNRQKIDYKNPNYKNSNKENTDHWEKTLKALQTKTYFCEYGAQNHKFYQWTTPEVNININAEISEFLGKDAKTELLLPSIEKINKQISEKKFNTNSISDVHFQNLVLKVSYGGRSILLPGDANENLVRCLPEEQLKNINTLLFPHHGSDKSTSDTSGNKKSGRRELFKRINDNRSEEISSCLGIISSNPDKLHHLPESVKNFSGFPSSKGCYLKDQDREFQFNGEKPCLVTEPIFITSNATLYYKLSISSNGFMRMYDSANDEVPVFMSDRVHNLSSWSAETAKIVSGKCDQLDKMRKELEKSRAHNKDAISTIINEVENKLIENPTSNLFKRLTAGTGKTNISAFLEETLRKLYQLRGMAFRVYKLLLKSKNPLQKSDFIDTIDGLTNYEWNKARDILSGKGLMIYNSSTKKWGIPSS